MHIQKCMIEFYIKKKRNYKKKWHIYERKY